MTKVTSLKSPDILRFLPFALCSMILTIGLSSCSDDDDNNNAGGGSDPTGSSANIVVQGALEAEYSGRSFIGINVSNNESALTWEMTGPTGQEPFWKLEFAYVGSDTVIVEPGTYTLGNLSEHASGEKDFYAQFLDATLSESGSPFVQWGGLGNVDGEVIVSSQSGNFLQGTFEVTLSHPATFSGEEPPVDDVFITGSFNARQQVAFIE